MGRRDSRDQGHKSWRLGTCVFIICIIFDKRVHYLSTHARHRPSEHRSHHITLLIPDQKSQCVSSTHLEPCPPIYLSKMQKATRSATAAPGVQVR